MIGCARFWNIGRPAREARRGLERAYENAVRYKITRLRLGDPTDRTNGPS
jgi:hypothetical protein